MSGPVEPRKWKKLADQVEALKSILWCALKDCVRCGGDRIVAAPNGGTTACPKCGSLWARFTNATGEKR